MKLASGFSLLELMVVAGLIGGMALFLMRMMDQSQNQIKIFETAQELTSLLTEIKVVTSSQESCSETFKGLKPGNTMNAVDRLKFVNPMSGNAIDSFLRRVQMLTLSIVMPG